MDWNFNSVKIKGKFYEDIKDGMIEKWREKYFNVTVVYKIFKNQYMFFIYGYVLVAKNGNWVNENVLLWQYNNEEAINNFSTIPMGKFMEEYSCDYLEKFLDEQAAVVCLYKTLGLNLELSKSVWHDQVQVTIIDESNKINYWGGLKFKHINIIPEQKFQNFMSKEEYVKNVNKLKKQLSKYYEENK